MLRESRNDPSHVALDAKSSWYDEEGRIERDEGEVTRILDALNRGEPRAASELLPLVYDELRRLAAHRLARETPGQTLQATALVHEAYLRLVGGDRDREWDGRGHFFATAAVAMRRILVEAARRKVRLKRGGERRRIELVDTPVPDPDDDLLDLDDALSRLAQEDPVAAKVVELRQFASLGTRTLRPPWASRSTSRARNEPTPAPGSATPSSELGWRHWAVSGG